MILIKTVSGQLVNAKYMQFSGGERHVQLDSIPANCEPTFTITAYIRSANDLMDLLLARNALDQSFAKQVTINLEIPYLPYARQDRVCAPGQAFSLNVMALIVEQLKPKNLTTWDCHSNVGLELTGARNIEPVRIIKTCPTLVELLKSESAVLVCPDKGAVNRCEAIQAGLDISELVCCEKRRDPKTGEITHTEVLTENLSGKCAVITDDICDGGYTFIKIAEQLRAKNAEKIVLYVTHGIFSKGFEVFDGLIDEIYTTNSFLHSPNPKLTTIEFSTTQGEK